MKFLLAIIICFSILSCNQNQENKQSVFNKKDKENIELFANSTFEILSELDTYDQFKLKDTNDIYVFIYTKEGIIFVDEVDYETDYIECLIFEFNSDLETFKFSDEEISNLNCIYQWRAETKFLKKETKEIKKGSISGKQIDSETWEIFVDIDTEFSFGGYFEKDDSRKISIEEVVKTTKR